MSSPSGAGGIPIPSSSPIGGIPSPSGAGGIPSPSGAGGIPISGAGGGGGKSSPGAGAAGALGVFNMNFFFGCSPINGTSKTLPSFLLTSETTKLSFFIASA